MRNIDHSLRKDLTSYGLSNDLGNEGFIDLDRVHSVLLQASISQHL